MEQIHSYILLSILSRDFDFGMEQNEPLNTKKMPREGIVLRKDGDPIAEAFKLKTNKNE